MDKLLPTRFLKMFTSMNVTKGPVTWKIEESNSQIFVTLIWDSSLESASATKSDVGESVVEEVDVLNVSTDSNIMDTAVNGQHEVPKIKTNDISISEKAQKSETGDFDIEIVEVDSDDDLRPGLLPTPQQNETFDSQEGDDDVIILDENGHDVVTKPEETKRMVTYGSKTSSSNKFSPHDPIPVPKKWKDGPTNPHDNWSYCGRRPNILQNRRKPLSQGEMKWELKRFTLYLRSNMGTRKLPLEHYVELHRQKLIMLNNWFLCRRAEGKIPNCNPNRARGKKSRIYKKKFKRFRKRPKFLRHVNMTMTVEEIKHEIETYRAELLQEYFVEPKDMPVDYYIGKHMLRINGLNKWFADKKKLDEEVYQGVWWKAPALKVAVPGGTRTPSSVKANTSTKTSGNLDSVVDIGDTASKKYPIDGFFRMESVSLETAIQ